MYPDEDKWNMTSCSALNACKMAVFNSCHQHHQLDHVAEVDAVALQCCTVIQPLPIMNEILFALKKSSSLFDFKFHMADSGRVRKAASHWHGSAALSRDCELQRHPSLQDCPYPWMRPVRWQQWRPGYRLSPVKASTSSSTSLLSSIKCRCCMRAGVVA